MKKSILFLSVALMCALSVGAKPKFKSINNSEQSTIIVVEDKNAGDSMKVTSAVLHNDGAEYPAQSMKATLNNGVAVITMSFKRCTEFRDSYVTININGKEERVNSMAGIIVKSLIK